MVDDFILCKILSTDREGTAYLITAAQALNCISDLKKTACFCIGDIVTVKYNDRDYPGKVTKINGPLVYVSCMQFFGKNMWKWPLHPDEMPYSVQNVTILPDNALKAVGTSKRVSHYEL